MNDISDDSNLNTLSYFNIDDFMRRTGIKSEKIQVGSAYSDYVLYEVFCTEVFDDYQALSDLLFKEYKFRISADVLMGIKVGILLDLLYRTDKNTIMFEKAGYFRERLLNDPRIMWPRNLAIFNRTLFYDEKYTKLSMPASTRCGDIYNTRILSKGLADRFYM